MALNEKCPKCGGESYLSEEDLAGLAERVDPPKAVVRQTFKCKSCGESFSRLVFENLDAKKLVQKTEAKKFPDLFEGFHKPGVGLDEDSQERVEVY
jgi:transposase-like protein